MSSSCAPPRPSSRADDRAAGGRDRHRCRQPGRHRFRGGAPVGRARHARRHHLDHVANPRSGRHVARKWRAGGRCRCRPDGSRRRRPAGRPCDCAVRRRGCADQQCRAGLGARPGSGRDRHRHCRRRLASRAQPQSRHRVLSDPRGTRPDARFRLRPRRQRRVGVRAGTRLSRRRRLPRREGGPRRPHPVGGRRRRRATGSRSTPSHRVGSPPARRRNTNCGWARPPHSDVPANRRRSPAWSPTSPGATPPTSPARSSWSTVGTRSWRNAGRDARLGGGRHGAAGS